MKTTEGTKIKSPENVAYSTIMGLHLRRILEPYHLAKSSKDLMCVYSSTYRCPQPNCNGECPEFPEVLRISDLIGKDLAKRLSMQNAVKRYHNKHKDSSGNFGFTIITKTDKWFSLHGMYNSKGKIYHLGFSTFDFRKQFSFEEMPKSLEDLVLKVLTKVQEWMVET